MVAKTTFDLPPDREEASLADKQLPLIHADGFTGEPGLSAVLHESDFAHEKPRCDVLLNGSAYAPGGIPYESVRVGLHVGPIHKRLEVVGDRFWDRGASGVSATRPQPFAQKRISYDVAYGGTSQAESDPATIDTFADNPVGKGFYPLENESQLIGKPLANTQEVGKPAILRKGNYRPVAFGALGRNFRERAAYAGTYDQSWVRNRAPFLPNDFDYRHFQAAPSDQQIPYPHAPLDLTLENLTLDGLRRFRVPVERVPIVVFQHDRDPQKYDFNLDTILLEPDLHRITLVRRSRIPLRKSIFDLVKVVIGHS